MGIDHRGFDIFMSKQFLHCTYIVPGLQEMCGKAVPEGMRTHRFVYFRQLDGCSDRPLQATGIQVVAAGDSTARVG